MNIDKYDSAPRTLRGDPVRQMIEIFCQHLRLLVAAREALAVYFLEEEHIVFLLIWSISQTVFLTSSKLGYLEN